LSLSAIAPTESTEGLIYALLPVSASLCLASILFLDTALWLSVVGLLAPFLALFLYEMGWDEKRVGDQYKKVLLQGSARADFYHCNVFIRTWETTLEKPPTQSDISDYLDSEYSSFVSSSLSSYAARRRMWRQRVSLFILLSIPLLSFVMIRTTDISLRVYIIAYLSTIFGSSWALVFYSGLLVSLWLIVTIPICYLVNKSRKARSKEVQSFLDNFVSFVYWQTMIATDAVRNPSEYQPNKEKWIVKTELESLEDILIQKDWRTYLERWLRVKRNIHNLAVSDFRLNFRNRLYHLWSKSIYANRLGRNADDARRRLIWFVYYSEKIRVHLEDDEASLIDLMDGIRIDSRFKALLNPNIILQNLPEKLLDEEGEEKDLTNQIAAALNIIFVGSDGDLYNVILKMMQSLLTGKTVGFQNVALARLIVKYVKEMNEHNRGPVLRGHNVNQLMAVYSHVQSENDRIWLLRDWFIDASVSNMRDALEERLWRGILDDFDLKRVITKRVGEFRGDYNDEIDVINLLIEIYPKLKDALARQRHTIEVKRPSLNR